MNTTFDGIRTYLSHAERLVESQLYAGAANSMNTAITMCEALVAELKVFANPIIIKTDAERIAELEKEVASLRAQVGPYRPPQPDGWKGGKYK